MANKFRLNPDVSQHHLDQMYAHRKDNCQHPVIIPRSLLGVDPSFVFFTDVGKNDIRHLLIYRIVGGDALLHDYHSNHTYRSVSSDKELLGGIKQLVQLSVDISWFDTDMHKACLKEIKPLFETKARRFYKNDGFPEIEAMNRKTSSVSGKSNTLKLDAERRGKISLKDVMAKAKWRKEQKDIREKARQDKLKEKREEV